MSCRETEPVLVCGVSPANVCQTLVAHHVYNQGSGSLAAIVYTDAAGAPVNTAGWTLTPGECQNTRVVELVYDVLNINTATQNCIPIELVKSIDCRGVAVVTYLDLTGAPYTVAGTLKMTCPCVELELGVVTDWSALRVGIANRNSSTVSETKAKAKV